MSSTELYLIEQCRESQEPVAWDPAGGETWFSVVFVAEYMGFEIDPFRRKLNKYSVPRHPFQPKCIRFSDLARIDLNEQSPEDEDRLPDTVSVRGKDKAARTARSKKKGR